MNWAMTIVSIKSFFFWLFVYPTTHTVSHCFFRMTFCDSVLYNEQIIGNLYCFVFAQNDGRKRISGEMIRTVYSHPDLIEFWDCLYCTIFAQLTFIPVTFWLWCRKYSFNCDALNFSIYKTDNAIPDNACLPPFLEVRNCHERRNIDFDNNLRA